MLLAKSNYSVAQMNVMKIKTSTHEEGEDSDVYEAESKAFAAKHACVL